MAADKPHWKASLLLTYQCPETNKGFFSVHFILISGLIFLIFFCFSFLSFVSITKTKFLSICFTESIELQKKIIKAEKQLFLLNSLSTILQTQHDIFTANLIAATVAGNAPAVVIAKTALIKIRASQTQLNHSQQIIILTTNTLIKAGTANIIQKIHASTTESAKTWSDYFRVFFSIRSEQDSEMAVQPRTSGVAPNYELKPSYKELQTVAFNWQFRYFTKSEAQKLLSSQNSFLVSCGTKPERKANAWTVEIQKDKYF